MESKELSLRFTYHKPTGTQPERYIEIRAQAHNFGSLIDEMCPDSREKLLAITALEECVMWANAAIARRENPL